MVGGIGADWMACICEADLLIGNAGDVFLYGEAANDETFNASRGQHVHEPVVAETCCESWVDFDDRSEHECDSGGLRIVWR